MKKDMFKETVELRESLIQEEDMIGMIEVTEVVEEIEVIEKEEEVDQEIEALKNIQDQCLKDHLFISLLKELKKEAPPEKILIIGE